MLIKVFNSIMVFMYRLTKGRFGMKMPSGMVTLLLTTTGRKSGEQRTVAIAAMLDGANYVLTGSFIAYTGRNSGWYHNLNSNPHATIQVKAEQDSVIAKVADPAERSRLWAQLMERAPGYGDYQKRTTKEIPMVILQPQD